LGLIRQPLRERGHREVQIRRRGRCRPRKIEREHLKP
jgi:hypothetical protein